jgi:hypothetical protein
MFVDDLPKYYSTDRNPSLDINTAATAMIFLLDIVKWGNYRSAVLRKIDTVHELLIKEMSKPNAVRGEFRWKNAPATWALAKHEKWKSQID